MVSVDPSPFAGGDVSRAGVLGLGVIGANSRIPVTALIGAATNKAGVSATVKVTLNIDKTPPAISITSPNNGSSSFSASQTISGIVTDTLSGIASVTCNAAVQFGGPVWQG